MLNVDIRYGNKAEGHLSQIFTGFKLLENDEKLKINSIKFDESLKEKYKFSAIIEVDINNLITIAFDLSDGYQSIHKLDFFDQAIENIDFYFKRSYDPEIHKMHKNGYKVKPLGLNYHVTCKDNPFYKFESNNRGVKRIKDYISYKKSMKKYYSKIEYVNFESTNHYQEYNVIFFARLWDSNTLSIETIKTSYPYLNDIEIKDVYLNWKKDLEYVTIQRIELIRALKSEIGDRFIGGLEDSDIARKLAPELIVDNKYTGKVNFMNMLKSNNICIASVGLHGSIGWKFAEYVAAGKCIVTDELQYELPGDFLECKNYEKYNKIDECINKVKDLLSNIEKIHYIENNNIKYYNEYLRPDKLVFNAIKTALDI